MPHLCAVFLLFFYSEIKVDSHCFYPKSLKGEGADLNTMIENRVVAFGLFVALFLVFWNIIDYLCTTFLTRNLYQFSAGSDLSTPLVTAVVLGYLFFLRNKED